MHRVGIVGCGLMGSGIAAVAAKSGKDVVVVESSPDAARRGEVLVRKSLARANQRGHLADVDETFARLQFATDYAALGDRQIVIEAVAEDEQVKLAVFRRIDDAVDDPHAILSTNTSSIPIMRIGASTSRPGHVVGIHFFNPVPALRLVEIIPSLRTRPETVTRARGFVEELGKEAIIAEDRAGFVVNKLLVPFLLSAIRMRESGLASAADIDRALELGAAHPQGPLALSDLIGLDTVKSIAESLHAEFGDPSYAVPPLLARMVEGGMLGRKSGEGFYIYT